MPIPRIADSTQYTSVSHRHDSNDGNTASVHIAAMTALAAIVAVLPSLRRLIRKNGRGGVQYVYPFLLAAWPGDTLIRGLHSWKTSEIRGKLSKQGGARYPWDSFSKWDLPQWEVSYFTVRQL